MEREKVAAKQQETQKQLRYLEEALQKAQQAHQEAVQKAEQEHQEALERAQQKLLASEREGQALSGQLEEAKKAAAQETARMFHGE
mmetsp:Transcript_6667/g.16092  ORF Transcript_6667/g.16092 Transcript_6667/m.16092 type:complete len:86 (+) Transcript_6667:2-259(+)